MPKLIEKYHIFTVILLMNIFKNISVHESLKTYIPSGIFNLKENCSQKDVTNKHFQN